MKTTEKTTKICFKKANKCQKISPWVSHWVPREARIPGFPVGFPRKFLKGLTRPSRAAGGGNFISESAPWVQARDAWESKRERKWVARVDL